MFVDNCSGHHITMESQSALSDINTTIRYVPSMRATYASLRISFSFRYSARNGVEIRSITGGNVKIMLNMPNFRINYIALSRLMHAACCGMC